MLWVFNSALGLHLPLEKVASNLKLILSRMGDAPVMPDGTQGGITYSGGTAGYVSMMQGNRTLLQEAYGFDEAVAAAW